ncbi:MAG: peroxidase [Cystobacter sp.]
MRARWAGRALPRMMPTTSPPEWDDVQGLVVYGYKAMEVATFLVLKIEDAAQARAWLGELLEGDLTTAARIPREERERRHACLNLAFTSQGLRALGLDEGSLRTFPYEFRKGMAERAHVLGDLGPSAPEHWDFGGGNPEGPLLEEVHVLLMLYGSTPLVLQGELARQRERLARRRLRELYCQPAHQLREEHNGHTYFREHFGFRDAISQPDVEGFRQVDGGSPSGDKPIATGEFLLGHDNEYGECPLSPSVPGKQDRRGRLDNAREPGRKDLGRHGTYLVLRKLEQDVAGFQTFLEEKRTLAEGLLPTREKQEEWLKAKLLGRWPNGEPLRPGELESPPSRPNGPDNTFGYAREDPSGLGCPVTAHVRRANPRDSLAPDPRMSAKMSRRHRILRRGITYDAEPRSEGGMKKPGLLFIALNTDLGRQFEFIQQSWLNSEKMGRMYDERDVFSSCQEDGVMTLPMKPLRRCVKGLQHFVTLKGGGYFFLPGVKALEFLADLEAERGVSH